jgi:Lipocalin-like domain
MARWLLVFLCLLLAATPAPANDAAKLVGTWKLASLEIEFQDTGERRQPYGKSPMGYTIFTPEGRVMTVIEGEGRKAPQTDEDRATLLRTMFAYSGRYRVDADKWTTAFDVAWNPAWTGTEQTWSYKIDGEHLHVTTPWAPAPNFPGKTTRGIVVYTRAK